MSEVFSISHLKSKDSPRPNELAKILYTLDKNGELGDEAYYEYVLGQPFLTPKKVRQLGPYLQTGAMREGRETIITARLSYLAHE